MELLKKEDIRAWDEYTINNTDIESLSLMERAAKTFVNWFTSIYFDTSRPVYILAGTGNNGGDGLAVARMLAEQGYQVRVHYMAFSSTPSPDNAANLSELPCVCIYNKFTEFPCNQKSIIVDALLGTGIKGAVKGEYAKLIDYVNNLNTEVVSIDVPSGMDPDGHREGNFIHATRVFSFEQPKVSFFTENMNWVCRPIGLSSDFLQQRQSNYKFITRDMVVQGLRKRKSNQNKTDFGFGQLCGGSPGMLGSIILGARAAMRCGIGRLSVTIPEIHHGAFLSSCPEVMVQSGLPENQKSLASFQAIGQYISALAVGPGLGTDPNAVQFIDEVLREFQGPMIFDADGLNVIAKKGWLERIPFNSILTPHEGEFHRLFGQCEKRIERVELQMKKSKELGIYIILKGANTSISTPEGHCYFNSTGNVGLGTAGSGDVLTGMCLGFLAQGYGPLESSVMSVFLHGLAGDHAVLEFGVISLTASDILKYIPEVIKNVYGG